MSLCWKYIKDFEVYFSICCRKLMQKKRAMGERKQTKNKLRRGHLDTLSARVYFGIGKERLSRRMVTSDWQLTVQCLFYTPPLLFFCAPFSLLPASPFYQSDGLSIGFGSGT